MKKIAFHLFASALIVASAISSANAGAIAAWDFSGIAGAVGYFGPSPMAAASTDANVTVGGLTRGSGIATTATGASYAWGGHDFQNASASAAIAGNDYATFSVTANSGYELAISGFSAYNIRHSGTGPNTGLWQYSLNGVDFTDIGTSFSYGAVTTSAGNTMAAVDLSGISALQHVAAGSTVTFRIASWGGSGASGTWYLNDPSKTTAADFTVNGTTSAVPEPSVCIVLALAGLCLIPAVRRAK